MPAVRAGLADSGLAFGAGFLLVMARVPWPVPRLGERWAELAEMPVMLIVIVAAARSVVRHFAVPPALPAPLPTSSLALALLAAARWLPVRRRNDDDPATAQRPPGRTIGRLRAARDCRRMAGSAPMPQATATKETHERPDDAAAAADFLPARPRRAPPW
jgi:hypothetical protein